MNTKKKEEHYCSSDCSRSASLRSTASLIFSSSCFSSAKPCNIMQMPPPIVPSSPRIFQTFACLPICLTSFIMATENFASERFFIWIIILPVLHRVGPRSKIVNIQTIIRFLFIAVYVQPVIFPFFHHLVDTPASVFVIRLMLKPEHFAPCLQRNPAIQREFLVQQIRCFISLCHGRVEISSGQRLIEQTYHIAVFFGHFLDLAVNIILNFRADLLCNFLTVGAVGLLHSHIGRHQFLLGLFVHAVGAQNAGNGARTNDGCRNIIAPALLHNFFLAHRLGFVHVDQALRLRSCLRSLHSRQDNSRSRCNRKQCRTVLAQITKYLFAQFHNRSPLLKIKTVSLRCVHDVPRIRHHHTQRHIVVPQKQPPVPFVNTCMEAIHMDALLKGLRKSGGVYIALAAEINLHHKRAPLHKVGQNIIDLFLVDCIRMYWFAYGKRCDFGHRYIFKFHSLFPFQAPRPYTES
nr:MAG TPA: hypothetical protein [Caudoviricetes sp.]